MRYLVATDGSAEADDAVRQATRHASAVGATLEVVTVLTPDTELVDGEIVMAGEDDAIEASRRTLEQATALATETADGELDVETELLTGSAARAIAAYADDAGADAIYVGHRGLSDEREQVVGSVAKSLVDRATVPVMVVR